MMWADLVAVVISVVALLVAMETRDHSLKLKRSSERDISNIAKFNKMVD